MQDPFFELRLYRIEPGRMGDMICRWKNDIDKLFPKHGVTPLGSWYAISGPKSPIFSYLLHWSNMQERTRCLSNFASDPDWLEVRDRTNSGSELVERYEILFLRGIKEFKKLNAEFISSEAVYDLILQEVSQGQSQLARKEILDKSIKYWEQLGANVCGAFDVMSGYSLPSVIFIIEWANIEKRNLYYEIINTDFYKSKNKEGKKIFERSDNYLMKKVDVNWLGI